MLGVILADLAILCWLQAYSPAAGFTMAVAEPADEEMSAADIKVGNRSVAIKLIINQLCTKHPVYCQGGVPKNCALQHS